jgi:predicted nucleotidyltransferase
MNQFYAKDFIETGDGLCFAVVQNGVEQGRVLCFLRYVYWDNHWQKISTEQANQHLKECYPQYLYYSEVLDAFLHAVEIEKIIQHHQPKQRLQELLDLPGFKNLEGLDAVHSDLIGLCQLFQQVGINIDDVGVTGSLLIGAQNPDSDIDLVFYDRAVFQQARQVTESLIKENKLQALTAHDWEEAFARRDCELDFADYVWHEQRKYNKGMINQRKFDLSLLVETQEASEPYSKVGAITLTVQITDDRYGFDYPAQFLLAHPEITAILCFTATYNGQAQTGEWVEVAGQLEISATGDKRIVVGSTREARGEYIKVLRCE